MQRHELLLCVCGCGEVPNQGNRYINGHNWRGRRHSLKTRKKMSLNYKGMEGKKHSVEVRRKMSLAHKGKKHSIETRRKISMANKRRLPEIYRKVGLALKGIKFNEERRRKISESRKGMKFSEAHRKSLSLSLKGNHRNRGKKHSLEARRKMSLALKGSRNPRWKGGIGREPYPFEFNTKLKEKIKHRDNFSCMNPDCWGTIDKLSVHHINYDKDDCNLLNLITLCMSCNSRANSGRNGWQELYSDIQENRNQL